MKKNKELTKKKFIKLIENLYKQRFDTKIIYHVDGSYETKEELLKYNTYDPINVFLYTSRYKYTITFREQSETKDSYLGCQYTCRKIRINEYVPRGNDLPDGKATYKTWLKIIESIVKNELVIKDNSER